MYVANELGLLLWFPSCGTLYLSSDCIFLQCINASCVRLFEDASVGYPFLYVGTEDSYECVLLELFERFNYHIRGQRE